MPLLQTLPGRSLQTAALALGLLGLGALTACGDEEAPPPADDKCPEISMEGLAGDWIRVKGSSGDHRTRARIFKEGDAWQGWYVAGGFTHKRMDGVLRSEDLQLTEVLDARRQEAFDKGEDSKIRLYFQPHKPRCAMRVVEVKVSMAAGQEKEQQVGAGYTEYLPFPPGQEFTYRPCDEQAFIMEAATSAAVADKQVASGSVNPVGSLGPEVPVGAWSVASEDGPAECTYAAALYFDDQPVAGKEAVPAKVVGDRRQWFDNWNAPYSGNHHFEIYRYRTCPGKAQELIAVACLEGILD